MNLVPKQIYVENNKVFCSDVDDTLAMHDLSEYPNHVTVNYTNGPMVIAPNNKNINLLVKFYKLGYYVIVWSRTGADWAQKVCEALNISQYVNMYMTKPLFFADDKPAEQWMEKLYREPEQVELPFNPETNRSGAV